jgi:hypothetical protein
MSDRRNQVSVRLDPRTIETIEKVAEAEARTVSNLVRIVLADWASGRRPRVEADAA